jgi:hypothetical protein
MASVVRVYLGGATRSGVALDAAAHRRWAGEVADALASAAGGATVTAGEGRWSGRSEPVLVVEAVFCANRPRLDAVRRLRPLLQRFLAATCQDAVLVTNHEAEQELVVAPDHDGVVVGPG